LVIKSSAVEAGIVILVGAGGLVLGGMFLVVDVGPRCRGGVMRDAVGFVICCIGETGGCLGSKSVVVVMVAGRCWRF